jgi:hypothetical protein
MFTETAGGTERLSRRLLNADNRTVRVSRDRETAFTATYLLTTATDGGELDASDVFHLSNHVRWTRWAAPREVRPDDLKTTTYRIGRTTLDRTPEVQERTSVRWAIARHSASTAPPRSTTGGTSGSTGGAQRSRRR